MSIPSTTATGEQTVTFTRSFSVAALMLLLVGASRVQAQTEKKPMKESVLLQSAPVAGTGGRPQPSLGVAEGRRQK